MFIKSFQKYKNPLCDIFGIGAATSGVANAAATVGAAAYNEKAVRETNETNKEINEATNQTNIDIQRMANELQISENEKAYQRSTASAQIAQLMAAGYSEQQAKQLAGGSVATYQPASIGAAVTNPVTMQAPQVDPAAFGNAAGQLGAGIAQTFGGDLAKPDGGTTGAVYASGAINFINENATEIEQLSEGSLNTFQDVENWMSNCGIDKYQNFVNSDQWKRCKRFLPAVRAFNTNLQSMFAANHTTDQQIKLNSENIKNKRLQNRIDQVVATLKEQGLPNEVLRLDLEYDNIPTLMQADYEAALSSIAECKLNTLIKGNKDYKEKQLALALQDVRTQIITAKVLELKQQVAQNGYKSLSLEQQKFLGIMSVYEDAGITDTEFGTVLSYMEAAGVPITKSLQKFVNKLTDEKSARKDWNDAPDELSIEEYSQWSHDTKWKRFFGTLGYDYQPAKRSDGSVYYKRVNTIDFWANPYDANK